MLESVSKHLEQISRKEGEITSFLIYPLLAVVVYEVLMRYAFNSPTNWGFEATTFLYGLHYMFGLAYPDVYDGHVRVDIFTALTLQKTQALIKVVTNLAFFMPVMIFMTLWSSKFAYVSFQGLEVNSTSFDPALWIRIVLFQRSGTRRLYHGAHLQGDYALCPAPGSQHDHPLPVPCDRDLAAESVFRVLMYPP